MDIDFPLVLTWAVLISGAIWLFDVLFLKPRRQRSAAVAAAGGGRPGDVEHVLAEPKLVEYARSFFPVLLVVLLLRSFLAEPYQIPSESMLPTLEVGDFILVNKFAYGLRLPVLGTKVVEIGTPQRGDVMVFIPPHDPRYFIKRVIGLPGDRIRYESKSLFINGERAEYRLEREFEEYLGFANASVSIREYRESFGAGHHRIYRYPFAEPVQEWVVPERSYFLLGDNRGRSEDSRVWGFASEDLVVGKAVAIWLHKEPGLAVPTLSRNRWLD
jgi:signal peptidase I